MTTVDIATVIESPSALTQEQGELVYDLICGAINKKEVIELSFANIESMISPFLNTAIGKLYGIYSSETINTYLKFDQFPASKKSTLKIVTENAKKYYSNKEDYTATLKDVIE